MSLFVSTVSADITVSELGVTLTHPTTLFQVDAQFSSEEIKQAVSLTAAIQAGILTWRKTSGGANELAASYDPDFIEIEAEAVGGQSTFGSYYQTVESVVESSNSSTLAFASKLILTTPSLPLGTYLMIIKHKSRTSSANRVMSIRVVNGAGTVVSLDESFYPSVDHRPLKSLGWEVGVLSGVNTFDLQWKPGSPLLPTGSTGFISEVSITIWRVK